MAPVFGYSSSTRFDLQKRRLILSLEMRTSLTSLLACSMCGGELFHALVEAREILRRLLNSSLITCAMPRFRIADYCRVR